MPHNRIQSFIKGLDEFKPTTLTSEIEDNADIIDLSPEPQPDQFENQTLTRAAQAASQLTPGQAIQGVTPRGTAEPEEVQQTGEGLSQVGQALSNPAVVNFLADMGIAFSGGQPNEPGTILGQSAKQQVQGQGVARVASQLLEGTPLSEINTAGLTPQTVQAGIQAANQRENVQSLSESREDQADIGQRQASTQEKNVESLVESRAGRLDLGERKVVVAEKAQEISQTSQELQNRILNAKSETELEALELEVEFMKQDQENENLLAKSLADFRRNQAKILLDNAEGKDVSPRDIALLGQTRNELITNLSKQLLDAQDQLTKAETELKESVTDGNTFVNILDALIPGDSPSLDLSRIKSGTDSERAALASEIVETRQTRVNNLKTQIQELQETNVESLLSNNPGSEDGGSEGDDRSNTETASTQEVAQEDGSFENPIVITDTSQIGEIESGQFFTVQSTLTVTNVNGIQVTFEPGAVIEKVGDGLRRAN